MIREIYPDDLDGIVGLAAIEIGEDFDRTYFKKVIRKIMIEKKFKIFVYQHGDKIAGYIVGSLTTKLWNNRLFGAILMHYVHPDIRNQFIHNDLLNTLEGWFRDNGCAYITQQDQTLVKEIE